MVTNNIKRFDDVRVFKCGADAKLGGDFLLVLLLRFTSALGSELLYGEYMATIFAARFDQAYGTTSTGAQNATPLAILFSNVSLSSLGQGIDGMWTRGCTETRIPRSRLLCMMGIGSGGLGP
jgi:hypothetical protein